MLSWIAVVAGVWLFLSVVVSLGLARAICLSNRDPRPIPAATPVLVPQRSASVAPSRQRVPAFTH